MSEIDEVYEEAVKEGRILKDRENVVREAEKARTAKLADYNAQVAWNEKMKRELAEREAALASSPKEPSSDEFEIEIPDEFDEKTKGLLVRLFQLGQGWTPERCQGFIAHLRSLDSRRRAEHAEAILGSLATDSIGVDDLDFEKVVGKRSVFRDLTSPRLAVDDAANAAVKMLAYMHPDEARRAAKEVLAGLEAAAEQVRRTTRQIGASKKDATSNPEPEES